MKLIFSRNDIDNTVGCRLSTYCSANGIKVSKMEDPMFTELYSSCFYPSFCSPALFLSARVPAFPVCKKQQEAPLLPQKSSWQEGRVQVLHLLHSIPLSHWSMFFQLCSHWWSFTTVSVLLIILTFMDYWRCFFFCASTDNWSSPAFRCWKFVTNYSVLTCPASPLVSVKAAGGIKINIISVMFLRW